MNYVVNFYIFLEIILFCFAFLRSTGWIAGVCKLNVVAQKRSGRPRKSWDEVIENDRKDSADPQNRSEWRGRLRGRLVKKPNPG